MLSRIFRKGAFAVGLGLAVAGAAYAAITFNPTNGTGFVGKGDVQYTFDWNNAQLQKSAESLQFRASVVTVTERSWTCTNENNQHEQQRERTITTTKRNLVEHVERLKSQITGFGLTGYDQNDPGATETTTTDGPSLNSCPSGPWSLTTPAGDPYVISSARSLEASTDGDVWKTVIEKP